MHHFIYGIYPYIAISVMIIASIARYERDPFTWKSKSSQLLRKRQFIIGSVLFHLGVLVIFAGHFVGLLTPIWVFDALGISHGAKQVLAVVAGEGAAWTAVGALAGLALGLAVAVVLVHVVNPQSFHWTMDLWVPWLRLVALAGAVVVAGTLTAWLAGRAAAGRDMVLAVKEDW